MSAVHDLRANGSNASGPTSSETDDTALADHPAPEQSAVDTLFYDGQCPLCAKEINQLRSARGDDLNLVDIHELPPTKGLGSACAQASKIEPDKIEPDKDQLLRVLHLRRSDGTWLKSADANVAAWAGTSHGRTLKVLRWPIVRHLVDVAYLVWARWRYKRLYGDQFKESIHAPHQQ